MKKQLKKQYFFLGLGIFVLVSVLYLLQWNYYVLSSGKVEYYQNGKLLSSGSPNYSEDVKKVITNNKRKKLINLPSGFAVDLPTDMNFDFNYSPAFSRASNKQLDIKMSREYSPYTEYDLGVKDWTKNLFTHPIHAVNYALGYSKTYLNKLLPIEYEDKEMEKYFSDYLNRFIENPKYRETNSINLVENKWININGFKTKVISFTRTPAVGSLEVQNSYVFAYIITGNRQYYTFFFRTDSLKDQKNTIDGILNSFAKIKSHGVNKFNLDLKPELPKWNPDTLDFYNKLKDTDKIIWGYFYPHANDDYSKVAAVEQKIDYKFSILLDYLYLGHPFPSAEMHKAYQRGQVIELTMQVAYQNNDNEPKHNANFDVIDGKYDNEIRKFAQDAKAFDHPFLFRLNNEMNTDWSQYSGVLLLSDSDIYKKVWQRIYNIFEQEGVNNAIWIFNPNDGNYPPANWNSHISYYPGNKYVQLLGVTGYNAGTYFKDVTGERWRTFDEIYGHMAYEYRKLYAHFPWIITEFASNSVGGDKAKWISDMFRALPKYPEIKAAVWWSYYDPDYRQGMNNVPARKYWLDEKDEYLKVFKEGLNR